MALRSGEFDLISRHFAPLAVGVAGAFGLGDDTARLPPPAGRDLVLKTDSLVAGVHFFSDDAPGLVARKLLRVNLSDLAAAGAVPWVYQLSTAWSRETDEAWIAAFCAGLAADQSEFGIALCGGDTVSTPGPAVLTATVLGHVASGQGLGRGGARPGDAVFVSGTIGDGALGLLVRRGALQGLAAEAASFLAERYCLPRPRLAAGHALVGLASACADVSDGLVADLGHIAARSGVGIRIEAEAVPLSRAAGQALGLRADLLSTVLAGGDDYELAFTVPPERLAAVEAAERAAGIQLTRIGKVTAGAGVAVCDKAGSVLDLGVGGWRHF